MEVVNLLCVAWRCGRREKSGVHNVELVGVWIRGGAGDDTHVSAWDHFCVSAWEGYNAVMSGPSREFHRGT